jgi:putative ABC transport system ATP-binding protein
MASTGTVIAVSGLTRTFNVGSAEVHAVQSVSATIPLGRLTIVKGRSGSGKTTLLNLLGLLDIPDSGSVHYGEVDVVRMNEHQRDEFRRGRIGFVYQTIALVTLMSAYENVDFRMRVAGIGSAEREYRVPECLRLVGLENRMHHRPPELSGGEQQRVAIARAIAHRPKVLFADEPTGELDTGTALHIVAIFKHLIVEEGITVVMSTHDPAMMELADHVIELEDGEVVGGDP